MLITRVVLDIQLHPDNSNFQGIQKPVRIRRDFELSKFELSGCNCNTLIS